MAKPPPSPSPGGLRSSRNRALEIGTAPNAFPADLPYDMDGGFPQATPGQAGKYNDPVTGVVAPPLPPQPKSTK